MNIHSCLLGGATVAALITGITAGASAAPMPESFAPLVEQVKGAVVNISTTAVQPAADKPTQKIPPGMEEFFRRFGVPAPGGGSPTPRKGHALGSGFIVSADGFVVTNNHVVENSTEIKVNLQDGRTLDAKLIGRDPKTDLAVLKVQSDKPLPFVSFGNSGESKVGDWVIAVGNPFGLGGTVTAGIVSALARDIGAGPYDDFMQVDASINPGNSGGPTFNMRGEVIGINTAILSPGGGGNVGIGFAIPADLARPIVAKLESGGKVDRGWLGVSIQAVTPEIAQAMNIDAAKGALVSNVTEDTPAQRAGLKAGDLIVALDGKSIATVHDLTRMVADTAPDTSVKLDVLRAGKPVALTAKLGRLADDDAEKVASVDKPAGDLGLALAPVNSETRARFELPAKTKGAVVVSVLPGSAAAERNIEAGDVIIQINGRDVTSPKDVADAVKQAKADKKKSVALLVRHGEREGFIALPLV